MAYFLKWRFYHETQVVCRTRNSRNRSRWSFYYGPAGVAFAVKVDDQTLLKARPIHQKAWDDINKTMEEARAAGDFQGMRDKMAEVRNEFRTSLEKVLTKDQLAKLDEWQRAQMERGGMRRGGGGGQGRPGGPDGN
ncbi:hypothetical protein HYR99_10460 [Candidatus Poribacteria bacterium]|nr:hypothetical protein [Candidatus Poribacteria bacterium]